MKAISRAVGCCCAASGSASSEAASSKRNMGLLSVCRLRNNSVPAQPYAANCRSAPIACRAQVVENTCRHPEPAAFAVAQRGVGLGLAAVVVAAASDEEAQAFRDVRQAARPFAIVVGINH